LGWLPSRPRHGQVCASCPRGDRGRDPALVVKASFFLIVRLWFNVLPAVPNEMASAILAALGSAAILFGILIAYSTVAQIGYLFLMFPLAIGAHPWAADAWSGGLMQLLAHAFANTKS
jgi:multicomponent Na+:H+ antiporter subunit D